MATNINAFLKEQAEKTKKTEKIPSIHSLGALADEANRILEEAERIDAEAAAIKAKIHEAIYPQYANQEKFNKSFNLEGEKTQGVQVTYSDRFSDISIEHESELKKLCNFNKYFEKKVQIRLKDETLNSVEKLIDLIGKDTFAEMFSVKYVIVPKDGMDEKQFELPEAARHFLKQAAPAIKRRK